MIEQQLVNRDVIIQKAQEIANMIASTEEVELFKQAEMKIRDHSRVQDLIAEIKGKQKELVGFKSLQHAEMVEKVEAELEALQDQLDGIPIVEEFKRTQLEINDMLQLVTNVIAETLSDRINVETGNGEGGCGSCGCS